VLAVTLPSFGLLSLLPMPPKTSPPFGQYQVDNLPNSICVPLCQVLIGLERVLRRFVGLEDDGNLYWNPVGQFPPECPGSDTRLSHLAAYSDEATRLHATQWIVVMFWSYMKIDELSWERMPVQYAGQYAIVIVLLR
jgi:hypothetical protein